MIQVRGARTYAHAVRREPPQRDLHALLDGRVRDVRTELDAATGGLQAAPERTQPRDDLVCLLRSRSGGSPGLLSCLALRPRLPCSLLRLLAFAAHEVGAIGTVCGILIVGATK